MLVPSLSPFPVISKFQITLSCFCIHSASECEGKGQKFHVFFTLVRNFSTISPSSFVVRFCRKLQMNILVCLSFNNNRRVLARAAVMNEGRKKFFTFLANSLSFLLPPDVVDCQTSTSTRAAHSHDVGQGKVSLFLEARCLV